MDHPKRTSDVVEERGGAAILYGAGGLFALLFGAVLIYYQGSLVYLGWLLALGGVASLVYAVMCYRTIKEVGHALITCPYCHAKNEFMDVPEDDETCRECHRLMPIVRGVVLKVSQVRCGFCNALNYYSEKSVGLICEQCDREIPIASSGDASAATHKYSFHQDDKRYDIYLTGTGHKDEQLIGHLQKVLALNRNQVKQMIGELPCLLLTGVPKLKAELLQKDLRPFEGTTDIRESAQS